MFKAFKSVFGPIKRKKEIGVNKNEIKKALKNFKKSKVKYKEEIADVFSKTVINSTKNIQNLSEALKKICDTKIIKVITNDKDYEINSDADGMFSFKIAGFKKEKDGVKVFFKIDFIMFSFIPMHNIKYIIYGE